MEATLLQYGAMGVVMAWLMFRVEKRLDRIAAAMDRMTRAQLLTLIARPDVENPVKEQASQILKELSLTNGNA